MWKSVVSGSKNTHICANLSYRRIRRYLTLPLKAAEEQMKKTAGFTGLVCAIVISLSVHGVNSALFIRELLKPLPVTERSLLEAKVPPVKRRTSCVYADLKELHLQMEILKTA